MKKLIFCFVLILISSIFPSLTFAQTGNFSNSADATYTIAESGVTHVKFVLVLTNNTSQYYASQYDLNLGFTDIENIKAIDSKGVMQTFLKSDNNHTILSAIFNTTTVGLNKTTPFTIEFDTTDVAKQTGNTWELTIPGLADQREFDNFSVHIKQPASFGKPSYSKPPLMGRSLDFTKEQLNSSGISIGFGDYQTYDFSATYHLNNRHLFPETAEIALPSDTNYQTISLDTLNPKPSEVLQDDDGNWLAKYTLWPKQTLAIKASGKVQVLLEPKEQPLDITMRKAYLAEQPYWDVTNTQIQNESSILKTPEAIYHYVVKQVTYDYNRVSQNQPRLGAAAILQHPTSAMCLEFTDLFIALARSAGIPAREVDGYGYTNNSTYKPLSLGSDILHAWPEYYDDIKRTWIMVDPTWGNTTKGIDYFSNLDLDHIAFVIKGISSTYPIPAGGYKVTNQSANKDIVVTVAANDTLMASIPSVHITLNNNLLVPTKVNGEITIANPSGTSIPAQDIQVTSQIMKMRTQRFTMSSVPPFGRMVVPISFEKTSILTNMLPTVTIQIGNNKTAKTVLLFPFISKLTILIGGVTLGIITIIIFAITKRARNLFILGRQE